MIRKIQHGWGVTAILFAAVISTMVSSCSTAPSATKPNIILILTDDMGYSDVGCYGGDFVPTPNIDRLAEEGLQFTHYYSASPICSASRTGIMTGMAPAEWNITSYLQTKKGNRECEQADFVDASAPTIAKTLKQAGYVTGHFGKWHMGGGRDVDNAPSIPTYGFDEYASTWESPDPDPIITASDWIWSPEDSIKRWERTGYFVDRTLDFLKRHKGEPCFVNLWPDDMHTPWVPNEEAQNAKSKKYQSLENFKGVLTEYDRQIGRLMDGLKELGIDDNTLVIFTSDNGPLPTFDGSRAGFRRGSKLSLYEGGDRLPFIVRWPARVPEGKVDSLSVISGTDLYPTLCAIAGGEMPTGFSFDGESRSEVIQGNPSVRTKPLFWEYGRNDYSFAYPKGRDRSPNLALREKNWKLLVNADGTGMELYSIENDQNETNNVADAHPEVAAAMKEKLMDWWKSLPKLPEEQL